MSALVALYPATPADVPLSVTQPSAAFKKEVVRVMFSIVLFFIVYFLLVAAAATFAAACVLGGIFLMTTIFSIITIFLGLGMMGLGIMVLFFLIKFIFTVTKTDQSGNIQVTEAEQPNLFAFIKQVTKDTQTPFPKKIFISPDVNASVSYNSSFWSMLFPVKKNLTIGLGLVNLLSLSEFKAVMAHEFGHFSQRSMKLGSFVYNVNRVIYNMLFENDSYARMINQWARVDGLFSFFASLTIGIVQGIQWVLKRMYAVVNKGYMGLSRQMEFHADAVAASVSGTSNCINALRRLEIADACYNSVIDKYNDWYRQGIMCNNVYLNQHTIMHRLAEMHKMQLDKYQLPLIDESFFKTISYSRVNFKNQWASHPARHEREAHLNDLAVQGENRDEPAWTLFRDATALQEKLTAKLYEKAAVPENVVRFDANNFKEKYEQDVLKFIFPDAYKGFYDDRHLSPVNLEECIQRAPLETILFDELFTPENASLVKRLDHLQADMQTLQHIIDKNIKIKTFDFDGQKYDRSQAPQVLALLETEKEQLEKKQRDLDEKAFIFFYQVAQRKGATEELKESYKEVARAADAANTFYETGSAVMSVLEPMFSGRELTYEFIGDVVRQLKEVEEVKFKKMLRDFVANGFFDNDPTYKERVTKFLNNNYHYFRNTMVFEFEFIELRDLVVEGGNAISMYRFFKLKEVAEKQMSLLNRDAA